MLEKSIENHLKIFKDDIEGIGEIEIAYTTAK